jgi:hypothetical protein
MPRVRPKGILVRTAIEDLWKNTLSGIPTAYGRMVYLASLRDLNSGVYRHHGLSVVFGRDESAKALKENHEQVFADWLNLSLAAKYKDLLAYLTSAEDPPRLVIEHWLRSKVYRAQPPNSARTMERELFVQDMEVLLETIRNGLSDSANDLNSTRPA